MTAPTVRDRIAAMARELTELLGEDDVLAGDDRHWSMDLLQDARATLARLIKGPAACEREASEAWCAMGADYETTRIRHHLGVMVANLATELGVVGFEVPGASLVGGDWHQLELGEPIPIAVADESPAAEVQR